MAESDEIQGVVEIKLEGAATGEELHLHHLSGSDASTLVELFCPVKKALGTLRTVTLLVSDAKQAAEVAELIRWLDHPALRRDAEELRAPASAEKSFLAALRCFLAEDGHATPDYQRCREHLARALEESPEESRLGVYVRRLAARLD